MATALANHGNPERVFVMRAKTRLPASETPASATRPHAAGCASPATVVVAAPIAPGTSQTRLVR
ncbi:MAG: hypothetical protein HYT80_03040 [Euryarchaeota archaeon]|nr:hypothetical protein [Euryarchaeota archaeon]